MRGRSWLAGAWDDLRLVGLKLIFLIVTRALSLPCLSRREWWWKDAEILMLRYQLAVAERERPRAHSRLTWPDRAWLALLAGTVPAERLAAMRLIVTPGTILRWQRDIVRRRRARPSRRGRCGRPATHRKVRSVVLRLARENESWGYRRIHGELAGRGIMVAPSTVWQILKSAGINRAPRRGGPSWAEFLRSQAQEILALDFFPAGLLNGTKVYVLAVIEHRTRRIRILGATGHPVQSWIVQQARNLLIDLDDAGIRAKFILHDRGRQLHRHIRFGVPGCGYQGYPLCGPGAPDEFGHGTLDRQLLDRTLVWNLRQLIIVLREYEDFYNRHRPHRTLNQAAPLRPLPDGVTDLDQFRIQRRDRAGGVIHEYRLVAQVFGTHRRAHLQARLGQARRPPATVQPEMVSATTPSRPRAAFLMSPSPPDRLTSLPLPSHRSGSAAHMASPISHNPLLRRPGRPALCGG
jgi:putative transposase